MKFCLRLLKAMADRQLLINKASPLAWTGKPIDRTAAYCGVSSKSVRNAVREFEDTGKIPAEKLGAAGRRGRHWRYVPGRLYVDQLRRFATEMNAAGIPVTVLRLRKRLRESGWTEGVSCTRIRQTMAEMGFTYNRAGKTQNFLESQAIREKRAIYLLARNDPNLANALFVWLDESYCNQQHVWERSWFTDGMVVKRGNKGRRWVIIHAGSEDGWLGEPEIFEARSTGAYHENMNADKFEKYFTRLCEFAKAKDSERLVVFCMDNAAYHRRETVRKDGGRPLSTMLK